MPLVYTYIQYNSALAYFFTNRKTVIFQVQLLYHDSSLGQAVNFVLKRLEILHIEPIGLNRPHDIDKYLSSFCQWQGRENPGTDQDTRHWDHALMLTGLDLYVVNKRGKVSSQVVGTKLIFVESISIEREKKH